MGRRLVVNAGDVSATLRSPPGRPEPALARASLTPELAPQEPPRVEEGGGAPPPGWPGDGRLEYQNVAAVYRKGLPPVLRDLTFTIPVCWLAAALLLGFVEQPSNSWLAAPPALCAV